MSVAVEIKRRGEIDGVEQLTRYLELLNRDPLLAPVRGIFAAQEIKPQARVLATDRGIACAVVDYDALRGIDDPEHRLFMMVERTLFNPKRKRWPGSRRQGWPVHNYFDDVVAETYDEGSPEMFGPAVLGPTVDFLAGLAGDRPLSSSRSAPAGSRSR